MLALGMFEPENFGDHPQFRLAYLFFLMATFLSMLTMLNMLIAIMGDTYAKIMEQAEVYATKSKLSILADFATILPKRDSVERQDTFLFVQHLTEKNDDNSDEWQGMTNKLSNLITSEAKHIQDRVTKLGIKLQQSIDDSQKKEAIQERKTKVFIDQAIKGLDLTIKGLDAKFSDSLDRIFAAMPKE